ncbi:MAG: DUF262 domain-containing protein [Victivallaceae bacterium]|nr:DUF262 domain-containing protein [Victivallaceae bacterium]
MNNKESTNNGERLSFWQLFTQKEWKIEIPIIQRDYAQGRVSATAIRNSFLNALYDYLTNDSDNPKDLDFIYGSLEGDDENIFVPLDGQQRLTTLFLLHWYFAHKENHNDKFQQFMLSGMSSKFTYSTRASAREFCDALVKNNFLFSSIQNNKLSETIKNSAWYFESWNNDPTVKAMLNMLDAIHNKFKEYNKQDLFNRLCNIEKPVITFQLLNIKTHGLTDDLYIKMNARGKLLEDFENFKAKFGQYIKSIQQDLPQYNLTFGKTTKKVNAGEYFSHKIDTVWADVFWEYRNEKTNTFDTEIMNFIRLFILNHYIAEEESVEPSEFLDTGGTLRNLTFHQYEEKGCLSNHLVKDLISIFDQLEENHSDKSVYENFHYNEKKVFGKVLSNNTSYQDKIRFYAFYCCLLKFSVELNTWMRVIYNLTENTIYDASAEYVNSIKEIKKLLTYGNNILGYLQDEDNKITSFSLPQIYEERIKAFLIKRDQDKWKNAIFKIEQHPYFLGQIGFILDFSGVVECYKQTKKCDSKERINNDYLEEFKNYSFKASCVFDIIKSDSAKIDFLWERAVLTKGDYLTSASSDRYNLLSTRLRKNNIERDHSWKRLLRLTTDSEMLTRQNYVKEVFDDVNFDVENIKDSLQNICNIALKKELTFWQKCLIRNGMLIKYCNQGFIKYYDDNNIQLLKESQMNHLHAELYSYALFMRMKKMSLPFTKYLNYNYVKSIDPAYIRLCFECYIITIQFSGGYKVGVKSDGLKNNIQELLQEKYQMKMNEDNDCYIKLWNTEDETISFIETIYEQLSDTGTSVHKE